MKQIEKFFLYIKYFFISIYGFATILLVFIIWIMFFDDNKLIKKWRLKSENSRLRYENTQLEKKIAEDDLQINDFSMNIEKLEKYAREKYNLKAPNEDLFIFKE